MTEAQIQLQNALTTTFLSNLAFLSEYDNTLYQRVENLSKMIEEGTYKERYELEFVMENGDFDIFDTITNSYLYGKNPKKINEELIKIVDFSLSKTILNLEDYFKKYEYSPNISLSSEQVGEYDSLLQRNMQEFSDALNDYVDNKSKKYKKIEKFVFFGTLLGRHIPKIAQKVDASSYMVFEKNLEIFRLSLFTVDYTIIAQKGVIFSIMDDTLQIEKKISDFLDYNRFFNYSIKYLDLGIDIQEYVNLFVTIASSKRTTLYSYLRYLYTYINRTTKYINEEYSFLLFNKIKGNLDVLKNTPILYLAAGPSLDENIDWVYKNQDKFFIVTIGSVYKKLLNKGIKVDLVTTLDEQKWLERRQFPDEVIERTDKDTVFLASTQSNRKLIEKLKIKKLFLFEQYSPFYTNNNTFEGFSIGEVTMDIILRLNTNSIFLLGLDLALNQKTGETHSSGAGSGTTRVDLKSKKEENTLKVRKTLLKVKGNNQDIVYTTPIYYYSIKDIESKISKKDISTKIYNISTHGAFFEGTIPLNIEDINKLKLKSIDKTVLNIEEILSKFSKKQLSKEEKIKYQEIISILDKDIKRILQELKNSDVKTYVEFREDIMNIIYFLKDFDMALYIVFFKYYEIVLPYFSYHFNDARLNQEYKKVKKIKEIFITQIESLVDDYILCIKRVV